MRYTYRLTMLLCLFFVQSKAMVRAHVVTTENINNPIIDGQTVLHLAVESSYKEKVLSLLKRGASIDKPDGQGNTPLIIAAIRNNFEMVKLLLEKGADVAAYNEIGLRALDFAEANENKEIIDALKQYGADKCPNLGWISNEAFLIDNSVLIKLPEWAQKEFDSAKSEYEKQPTLESYSALRKVCIAHGLIHEGLSEVADQCKKQ